ncbi:MAG: hypothetical protein HFG02_03130 [Oscillibacter sp.]|nr:hypothetical protein [Oscillibacter sp.]
MPFCRKKTAEAVYDRTRKIPAIRSSICAGDRWPDLKIQPADGLGN